MLRDEASVLDIYHAAQRIERFLTGIAEEEFYRDEKTQSAVLHQFLILGEAVKRISEDYRQQHAQLPWKEMAGMRDRLIHGYDRVDLNLVWKTTQKELRDVQRLLEPLIPRQEDRTDDDQHRQDKPT